MTNETTGSRVGKRQFAGGWTRVDSCRSVDADFDLTATDGDILRGRDAEPNAVALNGEDYDANCSINAQFFIQTTTEDQHTIPFDEGVPFVGGTIESKFHTGILRKNAPRASHGPQFWLPLAKLKPDSGLSEFVWIRRLPSDVGIPVRF